jgi:spectinomycin phosphotransferase
MQQAAQLEPSDAIGRVLQNFLILNKHTIARLIESADRMHQRLQPDPSDFVLCHTDLHAGNVLIDSSGRLFVIDWDAPMLAPKERDLMFIGGGVGNVWNQPLEAEKFFEGYGRTRIDWQMLAFYRFDRILEDIAIYIETLLVGSCEGSDRQQILQHFLDLFSPRGVVEIAFESEAVSNFD